VEGGTDKPGARVLGVDFAHQIIGFLRQLLLALGMKVARENTLEAQDLGQVEAHTIGVEQSEIEFVLEDLGDPGRFAATQAVLGPGDAARTGNRGNAAPSPP
jgi:hypothetical protein